MLHQHQFPLFGKLSAELRIYIYHYALADPERFLHICLNAEKKYIIGTSRPLAYWRCTDAESPFLPHVHECFSDRPWLKVNTDGCHDVASRQLISKGDFLIALLLSYRRL